MFQFQFMTLNVNVALLFHMEQTTEVSAVRSMLLKGYYDVTDHRNIAVYILYLYDLITRTNAQSSTGPWLRRTQVRRTPDPS